jgi:hypothetical protein
MAASGPEPVGVLILRAWIEGDPSGGLRVRISKLLDAHAGEEPVQTAVATIDEACEVVRTWLEEFVSPARGR